MPVGGGGVEGRGVLDSWPQNGLLHRRGSSAVGGGLADSGEDGEVHLLSVIVVDVAGRRGRWGLGGSSSCCGRCGDSGHGHSRWSGDDLLVHLLQVLFQDPDLVLHGINQSFHLGVRLFL